MIGLSKQLTNMCKKGTEFSSGVLYRYLSEETEYYHKRRSRSPRGLKSGSAAA
jgi:hypothetical protein